MSDMLLAHGGGPSLSPRTGRRSACRYRVERHISDDGATAKGVRWNRASRSVDNLMQAVALEILAKPSTVLDCPWSVSILEARMGLSEVP